MQIKLKGNKVGVEKIKAQSKGDTMGGLIVMPDSEEYLGHIRFVGETADKSLAVGQKVYFSTNYQQCRMGGKDICIMADTEIFAVVED